MRTEYKSFFRWFPFFVSSPSRRILSEFNCMAHDLHEHDLELHTDLQAQASDRKQKHRFKVRTHVDRHDFQ